MFNTGFETVVPFPCVHGVRTTSGTRVDSSYGQSFVPFLEGEHVPWRRDYLLEYLGKNALRTGGPPPYVAIHTRRYLYVEYRYRAWRELYDLRLDPWELRNLAGDPAYARIEASLARKLTRLYDAPARHLPSGVTAPA